MKNLDQKKSVPKNNTVKTLHFNKIFKKRWATFVFYSRYCREHGELWP